MKSMMGLLREKALIESDYLIAFNLRETADAMAAAVKDFNEHPTPDTLRKINGLWSRGSRYLNVADAPNGGHTGAGLKEGARLAA